jgi:hypothetical protein
MPAYTLNNQNAGTPQNIGTTVGAATGTILSAAAATGATTLRRIWLMEWEIGATGVPNSTDCPINVGHLRADGGGTSTAITPRANDVGGGDAAALGTYAANYTAAGTVTASSSAWFIGLNQRASYRIQMRDEWSALIVPAVNAERICNARVLAQLCLDGGLARAREGIDAKSRTATPRLDHSSGNLDRGARHRHLHPLRSISA